MIRRPRRTVPAVSAALLLLAAGLAVTVSLIQRLTGNREFLSYDSIARHLHDLTWDDPLVAAAALVAVVLGVLLLLAAVLPGRATVLPLSSGDPPDRIDGGVRRKDLSAVLRAAANSIAGVHSARVRIRRHTVTVTARTDLHENQGLADRICELVGVRAREAGFPVRKVRAGLHAPAPTARDRRREQQSRRMVLRRSAAPGGPLTSGPVPPRTGGA